MPDYSPDFTPRYRARYINAGVSHHVTLRGYRDESASSTGGRARNALYDMLTPIVSLLCDDFAWISAEYIPQDTNVGTPDSVPAAITGTQVLADFSNQDKATSIGYVGRSASTPMRVFIFGIFADPDVAPATAVSDFRITAVENAAIASSIAGLDAAGVAANNNLPGAWYQYVNLKLNDYWLRQIRKLGGI